MSLRVAPEEMMRVCLPYPSLGALWFLKDVTQRRGTGRTFQHAVCKTMTHGPCGRAAGLLICLCQAQALLVGVEALLFGWGCEAWDPGKKEELL